MTELVREHKLCCLLGSQLWMDDGLLKSQHLNAFGVFWSLSCDSPDVHAFCWPGRSRFTAP